MLTDAALKNLKSKDKPYKVTDCDGMYVRVGTNGTISFRYDYRVNGRRETVTFGKYGLAGISLVRAREKCISYALAPGATKDELRKARAYLADCLEERLRGSFEAIPTSPAAPLPWQPASANDPSIWDGRENPLAINLGYDGPIRLGFGALPRAYARILPSVWQRKADALKLLNDTTGHPVPLGRYSGLDFGRAARSGRMASCGVLPLLSSMTGQMKLYLPPNTPSNDGSAGSKPMDCFAGG